MITLFRLLAILCLFFNVSAFAVDCYQDGYRGTTLINGDLPAFKIPENAQPGQKIFQLLLLIAIRMGTEEQPS